MVEANIKSGFDRLPLDVIRQTATFLRIPETLKLTQTNKMVNSCLLGSQAGRYHLTRLALAEVFGQEIMVIKSHDYGDLPQAFDVYRQLVKHWTFSYARLFSFKTSVGFDMFPHPGFSFSNLYEASSQSYSSCEIPDGTLAIVSGVIVPINDQASNKLLIKVQDKIYRDWKLKAVKTL